MKMSNVATTKMSSKGQVVIPEDIRLKLKLRAGSQFVVVGKDDVVILKSIAAPSLENLGSLLATARKQAKIAGLKRSDIDAAVARVRSRK